MKLINKKILITGAAKRIGRILALMAAREGAEVLIHHNKSSDEAKSLQFEIVELGQKASVFQADFSDPDSTIEFINKVFDDDPIYAVINNASIFTIHDWKTTQVEDWQINQAINLQAPFLISQAYARTVKRGGSGRIINMLDWRALRPGAHHLPYTISKAGLAALTKSLAVSLGPEVIVNGIALGAILPPINAEADNSITDGLPIPRWATVAELEETVMFLLSGPRYITGEILHLDGGRHII